PRQPSQEDGGLTLGTFASVMVTDSDLDRAKRKLEQEETMTQQQIIKELRERLLGYRVESTSETGMPDPRLLLMAQPEQVGILAQYHTFGTGRLYMDAAALYWHGEFLGPISALDQEKCKDADTLSVSANAMSVTLRLSTESITSVRVKVIDDDPIMLATVEDDLGIGFMFPTACEAECRDCCARINAGIAAGARPAATSPPANVSGGSPAGWDNKRLVQEALGMLGSASDPSEARDHDLVTDLTENEDFMQ
ncbi:hypothetical protein EV182_005899, partial [Spiromyces aspiralis]